MEEGAREKRKGEERKKEGGREGKGKEERKIF